MNSLPFQPGVFPIRYLGVPLSPARLKVADFAPLISKVNKRIHDWKSKFLSFGGRKQLISSVLQSLQLYWMAVFVLPSGVVHDLEAIFRRFLWAQGEDARGKSRISWEGVCKPLLNGGLGIKRLSIWNRALVARHAWDILHNRSSLWVRWIQMHYTRGGSYWTLKPKPSWSWVFRSYLELRPHIRHFLYTRIGDGRTAKAWEDKWLWAGPIANMVTYRHFRSCGFSLNSKARDVILGLEGSWPDSWVQDMPDLLNETCPQINDTVDDTIWWVGLNNQLVDFSVKEACKSMVGMYNDENWAKFVWFKGCIPKHAFCMWLAFQSRLPTQDRICAWKHDPPDMRCPLCNQCPDSHNHLFFSCTFALGIWRRIMREVDLFGYHEDWENITSSMNQGRGPRGMMQLLALQATIYHIWRERNARIFRNIFKTADQICKEICEGVMMRMAWKNRLRVNFI